MSCPVKQDITKLISSFLLFANTYEDSTKLIKSCSKEEIINSFKLAHFIERTVSHYKTKNLLDKWFHILQNTLKEEKCSRNYSIEFFENACDHLLEKFFQNKSTHMIDIAVRMYTSLLPKSRFQLFLSKLLNKNASYKAILDFTLENIKCSSSNCDSLEYKLVLKNWSSEFILGNVNGIMSTIKEMMKCSKVEKSLPIITGILVLENLCEEEKALKEIIMEVILKNMLDRSILSKNFWLALFKIDKNILLKICEYSEDFLQSICNFCIYVGSMMEMSNVNSQIEWTNNPDISIYPEITYNDLLLLIRSLLNINFKHRTYVLSKIKQAEIDTGSLLWTQIINDI